jgi:hypothetical protein
MWLIVCNIVFLAESLRPAYSEFGGTIPTNIGSLTNLGELQDETIKYCFIILVCLSHHVALLSVVILDLFQSVHLNGGFPFEATTGWTELSKYLFIFSVIIGHLKLIHFFFSFILLRTTKSIWKYFDEG